MIARMLALFIGLFTAINLLGNLLSPGFDANAWWIHFSVWLPAWIAQISLGISAAALITFAFQNRRRGERSQFIAVIAAALAGIALLNCISFYRLLASGRIETGLPLPLLLGLCGALRLLVK